MVAAEAAEEDSDRRDAYNLNSESEQRRKRLLAHLDAERTEAAKLLRSRLVDLGLTPTGLLARYVDESFVDGVSKHDVMVSVLQGSVSDETAAYLDARCGASGLAHLRDGRTGAQYAVDLVLGWLLEDAILQVLENHGLNVALAGADKRRDFLPAGRVRTDSDLRVGPVGHERSLEIAASNTPYWRRKDRYDLRDSKFDRLLREHAVVLGIDLQSFEAFVVDLDRPDEYEVVNVPFHPVYKKPAKAITGIRARLRPVPATIADLCATLERST